MDHQLSADDYCARFIEPTLAVIRARLLESRPSDVSSYFIDFHNEIQCDIKAATSIFEPRFSSGALGQFSLPNIASPTASAYAGAEKSNPCLLPPKAEENGSIDSSERCSPPGESLVRFQTSTAERLPLNDAAGQHQSLPLQSPPSTPLGPCPSAAPLNPHSIIAFLHTCSRLKGTKRTGWLLRGLTDVESVADHSWRMSLMVLLLGSSAGIDAPRAMSIALVHDLAEALVGDIAPGQGVDKATKRRLEDDAMNTIVGHLNAENSALGRHVRALWLEYESAHTAEALFVKDMDKLEMILQAREYERAFGVDLQDFFDGTRGKIVTECALALQGALLQDREIQGRAFLEDRLSCNQ
jgi:putative hydrolases of HD superfamily